MTTSTSTPLHESQIIQNKLDAGIELTHREHMLLIYSDFHKDAYGFRPRGLDIFSKSTKELELDFDRFGQICKENAEAEAIAEVEAVEAFKAQIQHYIQLGAGDEETALRWMADGAFEDCGWDYEHYLWQNGILFTDYGKQIGEKLAPMFGEIWEAKEAQQKSA